MITISCDVCERTDEFPDEQAATRAGWTVAEDEPGATDRHGLCPNWSGDGSECGS